MKTLKNTLSIAAIFTAMMVSAQDSNIKPVIHEENEGVVARDMVGEDLTTPPLRKAKTTYERTTTLKKGYYHVEIKDAQGRLRMTGRYLDRGLTKADGDFTYYWPNGNVESTGTFVNGLKSGIWQRYAEDGTPKAEKVYSGKTWDELAVELGAASMADAH